MPPATTIYDGSYYLWDPRNYITVGPVIERDQGLIIVAEGRLDDAVKQLVAKANQLGKTRRLEIHCHGLPGRILLGTDTGVNRSNVALFGTQLRAVLTSGALIEVLCCQVASQGSAAGSTSIQQLDPADITGYVATYHGKLQEFYNDRIWNRTDQGLIMTGATSKQKTIKPRLVGKRFTPDPERDGLEFCRTFAQAAGATVRAAITVQGEDATDMTNVLQPSVSPIGNWEGPVFDFFPDRTVRCVGMAPYRQSSWGPIRTDTSAPLGYA